MKESIFSLQGFPTPRLLAYGKIHTSAPRGRVPYFFTRLPLRPPCVCWCSFVIPTSNEYHLSRVIMVHEISESVSLLSPLKQLDASWGYEHVPYPYACYDDENKKFQASRFFLIPPDKRKPCTPGTPSFLHKSSYLFIHARSFDNNRSLKRSVFVESC